MEIGSNIVKWRVIKEVKQTTLAKALGLSSPSMSNIENDITRITLDRMYEIARALDVPLVDLLSDPAEIIHKQKANSIY